MKRLLGVAVLAMLPLAADAQVPPRTIGLEPGITVQGRGAVKVPVKTVQIVAFARGNVDEKSVLAAMRAAGIVDPSLAPMGSVIVANGSQTLRGTIPSVTLDKLNHIGMAAADYIHQHPGTTVESINVLPRFDDCAVHEQAARAAAFADARTRAQAIAGLAGMTISGVRAVAESGGCPNAAGEAQMGNQNLDLATLTATISVYESITFETGSAVATRRRTL